MTSYTVPIPDHLPAVERVLLTEALHALHAYTESGMASDLYDAKRCVSVLWAWARDNENPPTEEVEGHGPLCV